MKSSGERENVGSIQNWKAIGKRRAFTGKTIQIDEKTMKLDYIYVTSA